MQKIGQVKDDDYANIHSQPDGWKKNDLVIYFQAYDSNNEEPDKRHFVLVIHSNWMRKLAIQITPNPA